MRIFTAFSICENKCTGQRLCFLCLCFRYIDNAIALLPKYDISNLLHSSVSVQSGLCQTWSETQKTSSLMISLVMMKQRVKCRNIPTIYNIMLTCP